MKSIFIPLGLIVILVSSVFGFGVNFNKIDNNEKKVSELEERAKDNEYRIWENELVDLRQTILLDNALATLERVNDKLDRRE